MAFARARAIAAAAVVSFGLYLLLAGQTSPSEIITGAGLMLLVLGWSIAEHIITPLRFEWPRGTVRRWLTAAAGLPGGSARTGWALLRALADRGERMRSSPIAFIHGPKDSAAARGRRATAALGASLAPDGFLIRMPQGRDEVLMHRIAPTADTPDERWLG